MAQNLQEKISQIPLFLEQIVVEFSKSIPSDSAPFLCLLWSSDIIFDPSKLLFLIKISGKISKHSPNFLKIKFSVQDTKFSENLLSLLEISISQAPAPGINLFSLSIVLKTEDVL